MKTYPFQRPLPQVKHVGTFPLFQHRRQARRDGFDDALFVAFPGEQAEDLPAMVSADQIDPARGAVELDLNLGMPGHEGGD